jgi:biofilm PGA synthesis protein PgaD
MRPLIIERPDLQTRLQRYGYLSVTLICWLLWLYLFVPLLSLLAWVLGATLIYQTLLQGLQVEELRAIAVNYGSGILLLAGVFVTWAFTSYLRFREVDRRGPAARVDDERLRRGHHLSAEELSTLRSAQRLVVSADQLARMFAESAPADAADDDPQVRRSEAA